MRFLFGVLSVLVLVVLTDNAWAQRFDVVEPSGRVSGTIELSSGRLLFFDESGSRSYFSRERRYDSSDGRFVGYFNFDRNHVLRFPRSCDGSMQTADLDDPYPRFRNTISRVRRAGGVRGGYAGANFGSPGYVVPSYGRGFGPSYPDTNIGYGPSPGYSRPYSAGYRSPPRAQSVLIDSEVIPNPPLPPARIVLRNDGPREVQVAVVDLASSSAPSSLRLQPRQTREISLERDSGAKRVAHYRVVTPLGDSITKEIVSELPPQIRYEVVVHEWAVQSIAIDRTGKSPNPIEDVNMQGRGIGRFPLPPGPALQSGTIDVYSTARREGNAGTVGPIVPRSDQPRDNASILERVILDAQRGAQQGR